MVSGPLVGRVLPLLPPVLQEAPLEIIKLRSESIYYAIHIKLHTCPYLNKMKENDHTKL